MFKLAVVLFLILLTGHPDLENIITASKWKVVSVNLYSGKTFPANSEKPLTKDNTPPLCGQIITFNNDHSCTVNNKGSGFWSTLEQYNWFIDNKGNLLFKSTVKGSYGLKTLYVNSANPDSILIYTQAGIATESGKYALTVYKLKRN